MSDFLRVTIACSTVMVDDANQLARALGYGEADALTFGDATHEDAEGNLYVVASGLVSPSFPTNASSPLVEPEWGADMEAAGRAQSKLRVGSYTADTEHLSAIIGPEAQDAIATMQLSPLPMTPL